MARLMSPPAATPWTARATIRNAMSWASPHAAEAARKSASAASSSGFPAVVVGQPARCGGGEEERERGFEQRLAAVAVAELAPQRRGRGRRDDISGHDP